MLDERYYSHQPDRVVMTMEESFGVEMCQGMAEFAVRTAKDIMPKISGQLATTLRPTFGDDFWGIYFPDRRVWYLEQGTRPFTMRNLAGKTIPMWVDDSDGSEARKIGPKAKTRVTVDGRRQVLIFRKAAQFGSRKNVMRNGKQVSVPRSWPGAPGRISSRMTDGQIGQGNVGVRWRHPGIRPQRYLNRAMEFAVESFGIEPGMISFVDSATFATATKT